MNLKSRIFAVATMFLGFISSSFAQVGASANNSVTIVTPVSITKLVDIRAGDKSVGVRSGIREIAPQGIRAFPGITALNGTLGRVIKVSYIIGGLPNYTFTVTIPSRGVYLMNGATNIIKNVFTTNTLAISTLVSEKVTVHVSAPLEAWDYMTERESISDAFPVTIHYN